MTSDDDIIPTTVFDSTTLPPEGRFEAWCALQPGYDKMLPDGATPEGFAAFNQAWLLDDLVVTANRVDAIEFRRTPAHIKAYPRETYTLILLQDGHWWAEFDDQVTPIGSGQICIMDFEVPWYVRGARQTNVMMVVPKVVVERLVPNAPPLHGRILEGGAGRLFAEHMLSLARHLPVLRPSEVALVRDATLSLFGTALRALPDAPAPAARHSQRALQIGRVRAYIDEHLTDPALSPATLCKALAVTRPTLYRAFDHEGGVATYIQRRRLEAAHARLSDETRAGTLAEIADEYCFSSPAHFSTAFRRQFGFAPRDLRRGASFTSTRAMFDLWREAIGEPRP